MAAIEHDGTSTPVHVTNLSGNGSAIARGAIPPKDAWITFRRKDITRRARVVWARDGRAGLHFEDTLNVAQILTPIVAPRA